MPVDCYTTPDRRVGRTGSALVRLTGEPDACALWRGLWAGVAHDAEAPGNMMLSMRRCAEARPAWNRAGSEV